MHFSFKLVLLTKKHNLRALLGRQKCSDFFEAGLEYLALLLELGLGSMDIIDILRQRLFELYKGVLSGSNLPPLLLGQPQALVNSRSPLDRLVSKVLCALHGRQHQKSVKSWIAQVDPLLEIVVDTGLPFAAGGPHPLFEGVHQ
jgi:hypothetical protein